MSVTTIAKDPQALTMAITARFDAPVERVWQVWADPRTLERWWGPPTYPATVVDHDLEVGGRIAYFMTGPEGDRHHGWWRITAVEPPRRLEFEDGFADADGNPNLQMPTTNACVTLSERDEGGTEMTILTRFPSLEAMEKLTEMGMEEGMTLAIGQIEGLLE
jgi:uncharacterized protein YndB with AHSA1/START domain